MKVLQIALDFHQSGPTPHGMIGNMCPGKGVGWDRDVIWFVTYTIIIQSGCK